MARKANYIVKLQATDERLCKLLKYTQHISHKQANDMGIKNHRIKNYIKQGVIKKIHYVENGKKQTAYELTKQGRSFINKNFPHLRGNYYTTSSSSVRHNLKLTEIAQRELKEGRELLTERDLREYFINRIMSIDDTLERDRLMRSYESREISMPDIGVIREDGVIQCYEVINENYTSQILECKANYEVATSIPITYIRQ